jgi:hypothetical protein
MIDTTLQLILTEQQRIGGAIAELSSAVHAHNIENAKLPEKVRTIVIEEMGRCPAFIHFDEINKKTNEHEERIRAAQERFARNSRGPRNKTPWWAPTFAKVIGAVVALFITSGFGAWGVHCSSASKVTQQASK